ncbi:MAG: hypothetical protein ABJQ29_08935 [Luteolibacter sp.]
MSRLTIRSLFALNILSLLLACVVILTGNKCLDVQQSTAAPTAQDFDDRLATKVGKLYTSKTHSTVSELIHDSFDEAKDAFGMLHAYGEIGIQIGAILLAASGISLFLLGRALLTKPKRQAEQARDGDAEEAV